MTKSIESMIEVLQAYKDGKKIEFRTAMRPEWRECKDTPVFNFESVEYRIAPEPKKKVKLEAWLLRGELRWFDDTSPVVKGTESEKIRVPSEDKEILI